MDFSFIAFSILFAIALSLCDILSTEVRLRYGYRKGLACWIGIVAVPIVVMLFLMTYLALLAMAISVALSGTIFLVRRRVLRIPMPPEREFNH